LKKEDKKVLVESLHEDLAASNCVFVTHYTGLNVEAMTQLRSNVRQVGGRCRVVKNTLLSIAAKDTGVSKIEDLFVGPTAIVTTKGDPVAVAKALVEFAKANEKLGIRGGVIKTQVMDKKDVYELATIPSREILLARLLGAINAPVSNFVGVLAAIPRQFMYALKAIEEQKSKAQ
jgi:large subunit ribosomal protein L10